MNISLTKLPGYAQVGVFSLLALMLIGAFYLYYEQPMRAEMATREQQLAALRADIARGQATTRQLPEFQAQVSELEARLNSLRAVLPGEKDAADLLRRMQTVATQSNLTIRSFRPAPVVTGEMHAQWPIQLKLDGTYHNLALFFDRVGKFTRIVNVSELEVRAEGQAGAKLDHHGQLCCNNVRLSGLRSAAEWRRHGVAAASLRMRTLPAFLAISMLGTASTVLSPSGNSWALARQESVESAPSASQEAPAPEPARASPDSYTYQPDSRRDPFVSLLGTGAEPRDTGNLVEGPASLAIAEISVRGVLESRGSFIAMIEGADRRTWLVHDGDRLRDGTIKAVTPTGLIIIQEVNDPLSLVKQREVHKLLQSLEDTQ